MALTISRRTALKGAVAAAFAQRLSAAKADDEIETHGLSSFGDLALAPDFPHFAYVNPAAPKAGRLTLQLTLSSGNQNFDTFDTLNIYTLKGNGAAGMSACFDTLMSGNGDEPDSVYGLIARAVRYSKDKLTYRFELRPEAKFADGARVTAADVAFSLDILKTKGHPIYAELLGEVASVEAESDEIVSVRFVVGRSRDAHLIVAGMPVFSSAWWKGRDFAASTLEAPLGSGPYKVATFEQGRFIEFELRDDYWGRDLPVNVGQNNYRQLRFEYYRERQVAFEAFKAGAINYRQEFTSRIWATAYDFPALAEGRVVKETLHDGSPRPVQAWYFNTRREAFKDPRIRQAIGLCFDFEWTNKNVMFSSYKRVSSFFQNTPMAASGPPSADELKLLEPWRGKIPDEVFADAALPPVSDGSGSDRALLKQAYQLLVAAGCKRDGDVLELPSGAPLAIEFLDSSDALQPHVTPFQQNLKKLGIQAYSRIVDPTQLKARTDNFDFDVIMRATGGTLTPGADLRQAFSSAAAKVPGAPNLAGIADPAVDALVERAANAATRAELDTACRALDRVLRASYYWVPAWYNDSYWVAYWNAFSRPERQPKFGVGAPDTWWWDEEKANKIGL
ncbi:MAG: extracellular solute-binding protein [Roseiarcus sp.]